MNISKNGNNSLKPVVIDFQTYVSRKARFKKICRGCFYLFTSKNENACYCDTCSAGRMLYARLQATKALLVAGGRYGYH